MRRTIRRLNRGKRQGRPSTRFYAKPWPIATSPRADLVDFFKSLDMGQRGEVLRGISSWEHQMSVDTLLLLEAQGTRQLLAIMPARHIKGRY